MWYVWLGKAAARLGSLPSWNPSTAIAAPNLQGGFSEKACINNDHMAAQPLLGNDKIIERDTEENKLSLEQISELVRLSGV